MRKVKKVTEGKTADGKKVVHSRRFWGLSGVGINPCITRLHGESWSADKPREELQDIETSKGLPQPRIAGSLCVPIIRGLSVITQVMSGRLRKPNAPVIKKSCTNAE